jgi:hypothetical protein
MLRGIRARMSSASPGSGIVPAKPMAENDNCFPSVDAPFQARENVGIVAARGRMLSFKALAVAVRTCRFRQDLAQCRPEPGVIIGDHELDAAKTARLEPGKKIPPARPAFTIGELDRQYLAAAVPVDADRETAWLTIIPLSRTRS